MPGKGCPEVSPGDVQRDVRQCDVAYAKHPVEAAEKPSDAGALDQAMAFRRETHIRNLLKPNLRSPMD